VLHVIMFFIQLLLCLGEETLAFRSFSGFNVGWWELTGTILVHLHHLLLAGSG